MQKNMRVAAPPTTTRVKSISNGKKRTRGGSTGPGAGLNLKMQALASESEPEDDNDEERRPIKKVSMSAERGHLRQQQKCPIRADGGKPIMKWPGAVDPPSAIRKMRSFAPSVSRSSAAAQEVCE
jgi:hypothetical protein